ncbi:MAG: hypothetical protein AB7E80_04180 [Hyphomicrobiaceae bacterium]
MPDLTETPPGEIMGARLVIVLLADFSPEAMDAQDRGPRPATLSAARATAQPAAGLSHGTGFRPARARGGRDSACV